MSIPSIRSDLNPKSVFSVVDQKIKEACSPTSKFSNRYLLNHSFDWFNLGSDPSYTLQIPNTVKWQLFHASAGKQTSDGKAVLHPEFGVKHLSNDDLALLYRILHSYYMTVRSTEYNEAAAITKACLERIERRCISFCTQGEQAVLDFISSLNKQEDSSLNPICHHLLNIYKLYSQIDLSRCQEQVFQYLDIFTTNLKTVTSDERENNFYYYLQIVNYLYPSVGIFDNFNNYGIGDEFVNVISSKGLNVLVNHFNTKEKKAAKYGGSISGAFSHLYMAKLSDLPKIVNDLSAKKYNGRAKIIVMDEEKRHYTPIFVERTASAITLIIADSGAFDSNRYHLINGHIDQLQSKKGVPQIVRYGFKPRRQYDEVSSAISAFRDLLECHLFDLFDYVKNQPFVEKDRYRVISSYPPRMMKIKQKAAFLTKYVDTVPTAKGAIVARKAVLHPHPVIVARTLKDVVEAHTIEHDTGHINFYLRGRAFKYFKVICKHLLGGIQPAAPGCSLDPIYQRDHAPIYPIVKQTKTMHQEHLFKRLQSSNLKKTMQGGSSYVHIYSPHCHSKFLPHEHLAVKNNFITNDSSEERVMERYFQKEIRYLTKMRENNGILRLHAIDGCNRRIMMTAVTEKNGYEDILAKPDLDNIRKIIRQFTQNLVSLAIKMNENKIYVWENTLNVNIDKIGFDDDVLIGEMLNTLCNRLKVWVPHGVMATLNEQLNDFFEAYKPSNIALGLCMNDTGLNSYFPAVNTFIDFNAAGTSPLMQELAGVLYRIQMELQNVFAKHNEWKSIVIQELISTFLKRCQESDPSFVIDVNLLRLFYVRSLINEAIYYEGSPYILEKVASVIRYDESNSLDRFLADI